MVHRAAAAIGLGQLRRGVDGLVILAKGGIEILLGEMLAPCFEMAGNLAAEPVSGLHKPSPHDRRGREW